MDFEQDFEPLGHGITLVDTGFVRAQYDAAYLMVDGGRAAFIDTGTHLAVPRLLGALAAQGLAAEHVDWVILTHVHLDHAGGAGLLMQQLPQARLVVHPRGARHMADPSQLLAGVRAVYGAERVRLDYGELPPVPPERIVTPRDGEVLHLGQRPLRFMDTPGHARHHHCIWDAMSSGWFCGDTLGIAYRELTGPAGHYGLPTTTPVQFDPEALRGSVQRLLAARPSVAYLTHFGPTAAVARQAAMVLDQMDAMVRLANDSHPHPDRARRLRRGLEALYLRAARKQGVPLADDAVRDLLATDVELNAQGLEAWQHSRS